ncbi:hypothetical protein OESDEN_20254 [Oesophagostomum dentatum]|uniref:Uncharacterized protein n=1 Tax=Oesophagostomum dentatum TaxID=61180 RepID=A0A0B1SA37_OESDE|nr:hypothetical protein OESDEN_20254 [Oesophagostomum dentatum]
MILLWSQYRQKYGTYWNPKLVSLTRQPQQSPSMDLVIRRDG